MESPLSRKFLDKLREGKPEDSYREPYVSRIDENDTEVCIDGWFALTDLERILDEIIDERDSERESLGAYPFEM